MVSPTFIYAAGFIAAILGIAGLLFWLAVTQDVESIGESPAEAPAADD